MKHKSSRSLRVFALSTGVIVLALGFSTAKAQETDSGLVYGDMATVTQDMLSRAAAWTARSSSRRVRSTSRPAILPASLVAWRCASLK